MSMMDVVHKPESDEDEAMEPNDGSEEATYKSVIPIVNLSNALFDKHDKTDCLKFYIGFGGVKDKIGKECHFETRCSRSIKRNVWPDLASYKVKVDDDVKQGKKSQSSYKEQEVKSDIHVSTRREFERIRSQGFVKLERGENEKPDKFIKRSASLIKASIKGKPDPTNDVAADADIHEPNWPYRCIKSFSFDPRTAINGDNFVSEMKTLLYREGIFIREAYEKRLFSGDKLALFKAMVENRLYRFGARDKKKLRRIWKFFKINDTRPESFVQVVSYVACILSLNEPPYRTPVTKQNTVEWAIGEIEDNNTENKDRFFAAASLSSTDQDLIRSFKNQFSESDIASIRYIAGKSVILDQDYGHNFSSLFVEAFGCRNPRVFNCFVEVFSDFTRLKKVDTKLRDSMRGIHTKLYDSFRRLGGWMLSSADEAIRSGDCAGIQSVIWPRGRSLHKFQDSSVAFAVLSDSEIKHFPESYGVDFLLAFSQTRQFVAEENDKWTKIEEPTWGQINDFIDSAKKDPERYPDKISDHGVCEVRYERAVYGGQGN